MNPPNAGVTARERARAELTREIKEEASRQLAVAGADSLSLRAVARSLGMVSSALYRYFSSRDELLTALIIDAYNAVGDAAEAAIAAQAAGAARSRWTAVCRAVRAWAIANPHEYALIYGSPVPGYRAPAATVGPASRTPLAFIRILRDAAAAGELRGVSERGAHRGPPPAEVPLPADGPLPVEGPLPLEGPLAGQAAALAAALAEPDTDAPDDSGAPDALDAPDTLAVPPDVLVRAVMAWTQLFGMISFELFGQFVGSFEPADALFEYAVAQMATTVGLP